MISVFVIILVLVLVSFFLHHFYFYIVSVFIIILVLVLFSVLLKSIILVLVLVLLIKISLMGCYIWYSEEGTGWGPAPPRCTKCNSPRINGQCTNHRMLYNGRCSAILNVPSKGLTPKTFNWSLTVLQNCER